MVVEKRKLLVFSTCNELLQLLLPISFFFTLTTNNHDKGSQRTSLESVNYLTIAVRITEVYCVIISQRAV